MLPNLRKSAATAFNLYSREHYFLRSSSFTSALAMSVLSAQENLPAMEPPTKVPRLQQTHSFKVKLLNEHATAPKRGSELAAGYDLARYAEAVIMPSPQ